MTDKLWWTNAKSWQSSYEAGGRTDIKLGMLLAIPANSQTAVNHRLLVETKTPTSMLMKHLIHLQLPLYSRF